MVPRLLVCARGFIDNKRAKVMLNIKAKAAWKRMGLKPRVQALAGYAYKSECDCLSELGVEGRIIILYFPFSGSTY